MTQISGKNTLLRYSWSQNEPVGGVVVPKQRDVELVTWAMETEAMPTGRAGMSPTGFRQHVLVPRARARVELTLAPPVPPIFAPGKVVPIIGRMRGKPGEGTERMRFHLYIERVDWSYPGPSAMTLLLEGTVVKSEDEHGKTGEVAVEEVSWVSVPSNPTAVMTGMSGSLQVGDGEPMKAVMKWPIDAAVETTATVEGLGKPGAVAGTTKEVTTDAKESKSPPGYRMIRFDDE